MSASVVRRWLVAVWIACAGLGAGGAPCYVIDLSGGPNANHYPVEMLESEPVGGWTAEHKTTKLVLRRIEPGTFMMCNTAHVTLTRPFYIGVFEVTSAQYQWVMGTTGGEGDARPEADISYDTIRGSSGWPNSSSVGADTFLGRLRARTGLATFDLPTEAQWEFACRAGTSGGLYSGLSATDAHAEEIAWVPAISGNETHPVGLKKPNAFGLYDILGNVFEYTRNRAVSGCKVVSGATSGTGASQNDPAVDPVGLVASSGNVISVLRGGCWYSPYGRVHAQSFVRVASYSADMAKDIIGFRVVTPEGAQWSPH